MTTLDSPSSSAVESTMDESSNVQQPQDHGNSEEESEVVWTSFTDSFREVQSVLDRNRALIEQVNENHRSKIHENMVSNVALIQEINNNVSKIVALYSNLSTNFSSVFHPRNLENDPDNTCKT
ncbi:protein EARLY FLOWERING 4-like [Rutidosis leptorrhynchoides]|uniref:protein EARLY FLOWERING 4-like n=1 Tax=Rutidosis leptorrhynchoides TaxID=125765 RepID=UPI003A991198